MKLERNTIYKLKEIIKNYDELIDKYVKASNFLPANKCVNECIYLIENKQKYVQTLEKISRFRQTLNKIDGRLFDYVYHDKYTIEELSIIYGVSIRSMFRRIEKLNKIITLY